MISKDTLHGTERGVSPVVGVILMVAITVILAAVIAAFTMGIADFSENPQAAVDVSEDTDAGTVTVQVVSNDNADYIYAHDGNDDYYDVGSGNSSSHSSVSDITSGTRAEPTAGDSVTLNVSSGDTVTVLGEVDGQTAVLETYEVQTGS